MFATRNAAAHQQEFSIDAHRLAKAIESTFYRARDETLDSSVFADGASEICRPA
jgi:hypothetical protein